MTKAIDIARVFASFDTFASATDSARIALVRALQAQGLSTYESVRPYAIEWAAARTKCAVVEGRSKAAGTLVLDRSHKNFEAAKKAAQRLMAAFVPPKATVSHAVEPVRLTRAQQQAAKAFAAGFEGGTLDAQVRAAVKALRALVA